MAKHTINTDDLLEYVTEHFGEDSKVTIITDEREIANWMTVNPAVSGARAIAPLKVFILRIHKYKETISVFVAPVDVAEKVLHKELANIHPTYRNLVDKSKKS
jgi:hypothetical protein